MKNIINKSCLITAGYYKAMLWLRESTNPEDVFATNRNNKYYANGSCIYSCK